MASPPGSPSLDQLGRPIPPRPACQTQQAQPSEGGREALGFARERRLASIRRRPDILVRCSHPHRLESSRKPRPHLLCFASALAFYSVSQKTANMLPRKSCARTRVRGSLLSYLYPNEANAFPLLEVAVQRLRRPRHIRRRAKPRGGGRGPMKAEQRLSANPRAAAALPPSPSGAT